MKILIKTFRLICVKTTTHFILLVSLLLAADIALASNHLTQNLKMVGQGKMSWFFIDLYHAELYSPNGQYKHKNYPQALNITYQKDIDKDHLVSATEKEWQKLAIDNEQQPIWLSQLNAIWPDIRKGDQLLFMVENDGSGYFYHNNQLLGAVNNPHFSEAFLSIWLSQNSSQPTLRKQLLGE
jgi:hypothetical protein